MGTMNDRFSEVLKAKNEKKIDAARKLQVSSAFISLICKGESGISDRTVSDFCRIYNVNEEWLRDGSGEMFCKRTRNEEIASYMGQVLSGKRTEIEELLITFMSRTSPEEWEILSRELDRLIEIKKEADAE